MIYGYVILGEVLSFYDWWKAYECRVNRREMDFRVILYNPSV